MSENGITNSVVEALILASPEPLPARKIADVVEGLSSSGVTQAVSELNNRYLEAGSSYRIRELAGGYQFYITPEFAGYVEELYTRRRKMRLTRAALETLAIIAYRQPVTKTDIENIRGVGSDGVLHNLLEKDMILVKGRAETVGKPLQYGTTDGFLKFFGLSRLDDMPRMSEIEELVAVAEPQSQTEMLLAGREQEADDAVKLNIADGTFDPESRYEAEMAVSITADDTDDDRTNPTVKSMQDGEHEDQLDSGGNGDSTGEAAVVDVDSGGSSH